MKVIIAGFLLPLGLLIATQALAQDIGNVTQAIPVRDADHVVIGLGAIYSSGSEGGDIYRFLPVPVVDIKKGRFFANLRDGIGVDVVDTDFVTVGASITTTQGRRASDVPPGIGSVSFGAGAHGFIRFHDHGFFLTFGGTQGFAGGTQGFVADANLSYPVSVSKRLTISPAISTT